MLKQYENILVIRLSALGDAVNTFPILQLLRQTWPQAKLSFMTSPMLAGLMETDELINTVIPHQRSWRISNILPAMFQLRSKRFDLIIDLQSSRYSRWLTWATAAQTRIGNRPGFFYTHSARMDAAQHQACRHFLNMLGVIGFPQQQLIPRFPALDTCIKHAQGILNDNKLTAGDYVVFNPGHSPQWKTKRWPLAHWQELAMQCLNNGLAVVVAGGQDENQVANDMSVQSNGRIVSLAGKTSLQQLAGIMAGARAVVSTDSGPMHVAAMVGTPVVALFGPTNPVPSAPLGEQHRVIHHELSCSRCFKKQCPYQHECLDQMKSDEVWQVLQGVLHIDR